MAAVWLSALVLLLGVFVNLTDGACSVSCTTDYFSRLNCSLSAPKEGLASYDVEAICGDEGTSVNGSCVITPPHQWCIIQPDIFFIIVEPDTVCSITANELPQKHAAKQYQQTVRLKHIIQPHPPINLTLTENDQGFNLSWHMICKEDQYALVIELMYSVRLRLKDYPAQVFKEFIVREDCSNLEIPFSQLLPGRTYIIDVRASANPEWTKVSGNEWSEWSLSIEGKCPGAVQADLFLLGMMAVLVVVSVVLMLLFGKIGWSKRMRLLDYIPNPQDFFKPLYNTYEGDFKKWVGPVFTFNSFDVLEKNLPLQVLSEKQLAIMPLQQRESPPEPGSGGGSSGGGGGGGGGGTSGSSSCLGDWSLLSLVNPNSSKRYFLGGSSLGISMDTVTVSGQEGSSSSSSMLDWTGGSGRTRPSPEGHQGVSRRVVAADDEAELLRGFDDWHLRANDVDNIEEISLSSYNSTEQSDYGYPQMGLDLDTIDSGFLESDCSSPVTSECDGAERMDAALLGGDVIAHSNYVKQWVAVIPVTENGSDNEQNL